MQAVKVGHGHGEDDDHDDAEDGDEVGHGLLEGLLDAVHGEAVARGRGPLELVLLRLEQVRVEAETLELLTKINRLFVNQLITLFITSWAS